MAGDTRIGDLIFQPKVDEEEYVVFFYDGSEGSHYIAKDDAKKIIQHLTDVFELEHK